MTQVSATIAFITIILIIVFIKIVLYTRSKSTRSTDNKQEDTSRPVTPAPPVTPMQPIDARAATPKLRYLRHYKNQYLIEDNNEANELQQTHGRLDQVRDNYNTLVTNVIDDIDFDKFADIIHNLTEMYRQDAEQDSSSDQEPDQNNHSAITCNDSASKQASSTVTHEKIKHVSINRSIKE